MPVEQALQRLVYMSEEITKLPQCSDRTQVRQGESKSDATFLPRAYVVLAELQMQPVALGIIAKASCGSLQNRLIDVVGEADDTIHADTIGGTVAERRADLVTPNLNRTLASSEVREIVGGHAQLIPANETGTADLTGRSVIVEL